MRHIDEHPLAIDAVNLARRRLPGDDRYGDSLSLAGGEPAGLIGQRLTSHATGRSSAVRGLGLGALQVFQSISEAQGRGHGSQELTIMFTDLVDFSDWALAAGDDLALELLRRVDAVMDREIQLRGGYVVKRLGDGVMAVFDEPAQAVACAVASRDGVAQLEVAGHRVALRAGIHLGTPRKLGGDYFGVDVNVAARVAAAAGEGEVLISERLAEHASTERGRLRRRWSFRGKGLPKGLKVYSVQEGPAEGK